MISTPVTIPGYRISEPLYNGSQTLVYRAVRESDSLPVVIKLLKNPYPSFSELLSFRNQYTITKNLNSPLIIQTYSLEFFQNGYMLVMEDFGGVSLKNYFIQNQRVASLEEFLVIAIALCDILSLLYHERIIHKDIKPSNILINPETKQVKLIDFSIASLLPREIQILVNPNVLEGTLAYISPEQTGRMNRGIDYRTDFYSLGVTFYELLTGELPFASIDVMELVHSHLAKIPTSIHEINPDIPLVISKIVNKLMAKNAEDRYQSALGLKIDLEKCLNQLRETGEIQSFKIASRDVCDRFIIPDKLYGREREVQILLEAFARVSLGKTEMMLVAGFSGIGKTAVVNEVHKPIVRQRGYFIKGKFDQFNRNIPFNAFVQSFRDLMGQLLTESDVQIEQWRSKILEAVGDSGQVIIEVIPELENIIGKQPPAIELSGIAAQNRFNFLLQKFLQVFTQKEHPLVIFLDDLQWADSASLNLIQLLTVNVNQGYLLLIGAYRDNEIFPAHPLMMRLKEISKAEVIVNTITLAPLSHFKLNQLIADTLKCSEDSAFSLSQLIYRKTQGNPFFATQLLKSLYQDKLIEFNLSEGCWQCDISQINQQTLTDDVVKFMVFQLQRLPQSTQSVLKLAACIGNSFDLQTLAIVCQLSEVEAATDLWAALQADLILPQSDIYKFYQGEDNDKLRQENESTREQIAKYRFLHDRVQQAAYSLIPDQQKQATHYQIGQLLQEKSSQIEREEKLFDIVGHLNLGQALIIQSHEREALAQLNLEAGLKARNSTAYVAAKVYLQMGIELLKTDCWHCQYELTLNLYVAAAEAAYLNADIDSMEQMAGVVLQNAQTIFDKIKIYQIQILALTAQGKPLEAIAVGSNAVGKLGVEFPTTTDETKISKALENLANLQNGREIEELVDLPVMSDRQTLAAMQILGILFPSITQGIPQLLPIQSTVMVSLSIQFGNAPASSVGYMIHGMVMCAFFKEVKTGYRFGKLGLNLLEQFNVKEFASLLMHLFGAFIQHHQESIKSIVATLKEGYVVGMETGDFMDAGYSASNYINASFISGIEIDTWKPEIASYKAVLVEKNQYSAGNYVDIVHQTVQNLTERAILPDCLIGNAYDETVMLPQHYQEKDFVSISIVYIYKLFLAYLFGNYKNAIDHSTEAKKCLTSLPGLIFIPIFHFYTALAHLILFPTQPELEQAKILAQVETHQTALQQMAQNSPMNYLHKWYLVEAEKNRVLDHKSTALEHYDLAICRAKENGYLQEEALANELAAKFYLGWGKEKVAALYMQKAYYCYARWGAKAKVDDLEKRYPQLLAPILQQSRSQLATNETIFTWGTVTSSSSGASSSSFSDTLNLNTLDLIAILTAYQTISSEIELDKLLASLLSIIIENAGADKCVLMLLQNDHLLIQGAIIQGTQPIVLQSLAIADSPDIPHKLIYKVKNSQQTVVLLDATVDTTLTNDPYIIRQQPLSILCSPILHQGKLLGIIYLENNSAKGAFTSDRIEILNLLCTQAAISLENAQLYQRSQKSAQQLKRSLNEVKIAQSRFHNLVDNVPGVVYQFLIAPDGSMSLPYISNDCYDLYEISAEDAIANVQILLDVVHPEDKESHRQSIADSVQSLTPWQWEGRIITPSGIIKWIHGAARLEKLVDGTLVWDGWLLDISERKQAELDLQQAQLQIIQSEKMSVLGNLVAGVAHEMNNSLGFITANLKQSKSNFADIIEHLKLYQATFLDQTEEILNHESEIDLEYTIEDLPKILDSMTTACDNLKNLSTSLRIFSRTDQDCKVSFNIHEGIDITILILKHRLQANEQRPAIEVITNYGDLPPVECFPGQLNQVFMNILANAIDALEASNHGKSFAEIAARPNRIQITTLTEDRFVKILIADNGKGMSAEVKHKIFDHLFTTKGVGKGTGLGLAIARQIVTETHGGKLSCHSVLGRGTEFVVEIPVV